MLDEIKIEPAAAEYLEAYLIGMHSVTTLDPALERTLDPNNDMKMGAYNDGFAEVCSKLGHNQLDVMDVLDANQHVHYFQQTVRRIKVRNGAETQVWNDAAEFFQNNVRAGEELVLPLLPGRTLIGMYAAMRSALARRGLKQVKVVPRADQRMHYDYVRGRWVNRQSGKPILAITHDKYAKIKKQYNFFDVCGGAVVYIKDEPYYGEYLGEEVGKLKFVLLMNDREQVVKFSPAYCNKCGQYTWNVKG